jgi:hypothetical protein
MKDGGGENSVRAGKLTGLDHGLSEIEQYIAHLRRKKARGDWGEDDGLRWREVKMKQARMRISLEDTLMQEHGESEVERRQEKQVGEQVEYQGRGGLEEGRDERAEIGRLSETQGGGRGGRAEIRIPEMQGRS